MPTKKDKIIEQAQKFHKEIAKRQSYQREIGKECAYMVAGDQWKPKDVEAREKVGRPVITVNRLAAPVDYKVNQRYENLTAIKFVARNEGEEDKAEILTGLVRHIEHSNISNAKEAYRHADRCMVISGFGYYRVDAKHTDEMSLEQDLVIEKINDPFSVYMDKDNNDFCLITERMTKEQFKAKFPDAETESWEDCRENSFLLDDGDVIVAEWWERKHIPTKIHEIETSGEQMGIEEPELVTKIVTDEELQELEEGTYRIFRSRDTKIPKVTQYFLSPTEIMDTTEWKGKYIPVIGVYGDEHEKRSGEKFCKGMVNDGLDPQRMFNYNKSGQVEAMQEAPNQTPVGAPGQFEGFEDEWKSHKQYAFIRYNPVSISGQLLPPPSPLPRTNGLSEYAQSTMEYGEDLKATTRVYDPTLGLNPRGESGKALVAQQNVTNLALAHFDINSEAAQRRAGLIILDLIPHYYPEKRKIKILGKDMREKIVTINSPYKDNDGQEKYHDLSQPINCDVVIQASYSAGTRRQEIVDRLIEFGKTFPMAQDVIGDMVADNLDMQKSDELANRMRAKIAPELWARIEQMEEEEKRGFSPTKEVMQRMQTALQQMRGELEKRTEDAKQLFQALESEKKKNEEIKLKTEQVRQTGDIEEENIRRQSAIEVEELRQRGATERELIKNRNRM